MRTNFNDQVQYSNNNSMNNNNVNTSILVQNVSVCYHMPSERINSLKEVAIRRVTGRKISFSDFYALRGVSVQIKVGEAVALFCWAVIHQMAFIQPNGSGAQQFNFI